MLILRYIILKRYTKNIIHSSNIDIQVSNRHFKLQIIKFTLVAIRAKYKGEKTPSINVDTDSSCIFISLTTKSLKKRDVPYNL